MRIKKKDKVLVLSGRDKGKRGEILTSSGEGRYLVSKINMLKKHKRATQTDPGGIIEMEAPIHQSKLMLICPRCDSPTRPSQKVLEDKTKVRVCRNCSEMIE
jgi:large subunit ribosomal protein L24